MIYFETPRLLLRDWHDDDLQPFTAMNADPRVMEFFPSPLTDEESAAFLGRIRAEFGIEGFGPYAVQRREDGALLGYTGFHRITFSGELHNKIEIGWRMCPQAWGHGYATEAAQTCLNHATALGIDTVYAFTTVTNQRSERVMQRLGMVRIAEFDHPALPAGDPLLRHVLYQTK